MVLINEKKFACATCIKGHRVSGCTHTDRPLFEVKKKGRPATQCTHCKDKRKGSGSSGAVHTKCQCGDPKPPTVIMPSGSPSLQAGPSSSTEHSPTPTPFSPGEGDEDTDMDTATRKGRPGSKATFPNGLRDVHEMSYAEASADEAFQAAERRVQNLLNPCHCKTTGICKCCQPKTERRSKFSPGPSTAGSSGGGGGSCCGSGNDNGGDTDQLVELFKSKASTSSMLSPDISPTSHGSAARHQHRAKLYSPYTTPRHASGSARSPSANSPPSSATRPPSRLRPLTDMNQFLGAVFNADGSFATQIPRTAIGLPGITTFDEKAAEGGVKIEPMDVDPVSQSVSFPTSEDVVIGACTCGPNCECPGCSIHGHASGGDHTGHEHAQGVPCGAGCKSSFDCTDNVAIPSGATSVEHLLSLAAANVPPPPRPFTAGELNAHDTRILPPAINHSPDAALQLGVVQLKPLECCNGRCQCAPGKCTCEKECCGCCIRCACSEEQDAEGDSNMEGQGSSQNAPMPLSNGQTSSSCCGGGSGPTTTTIPTGHARNPSLSVTAPQEDSCASSSASASGSGHSPNPSLSFSSADELHFGASPTLSSGHHSPRPSLSITTAPDGSPLGMPPFNLDLSPGGAGTLNIHAQTTPPLLSPESARLPPGQGQSSTQGIPLLSPESARLPSGSSPSSPRSPHSPRSPRSPRSSRGRRSNQSSRSSTPSKEKEKERDDGEPATKRRASFTLQGSNPVTSTEETGSRRATLGGGTSPTPALSRSSSTGKASSKALALNTQPNHPRSSTHKASSSSSGHLLPPPAGSTSGGSRTTSPHRRRASSGLPSPTKTTTPEPRSPTSHGHSASLGQLPIPTLPQYSPSIGHDPNQQPPAINIDSVNVDGDDEYVPDADLLAYINQLTSSSAGTSDVSSIPTNFNFDFINPFEQQQQPVQQQGMQQQHDMSGSGIDMMNGNGNGDGTISTGDFLSMLNQVNGGQQLLNTMGQLSPLAAPGGGPMPSPLAGGASTGGLSQSMSGLYLGQPHQQQQHQQHMGGMPDMRFDQHHHQQPPSRDPIQPEYAAFMQQQQQQQAWQQQLDQGQQPKFNSGPNPNLIDLSKPLNAGDVERILRALQDQQKNDAAQQQQQQPSLPQMPPPMMPQQQQQQRPPLRPQQQQQQPMMLPQHPPQAVPTLSPLEAIQQAHRRQQDELFDKFMLDPSPSAPDMSNQQSGFDFNQMYGGINPAHVHMSMLQQQQQQQSPQQPDPNSNNNGGGGGPNLTWDQLRMWAASHGMQAPPGPLPQ